MDTPFERLDPETRQEWQEHPTTIAYVATLGEEYKRALTTLVDAVQGAGGFDLPPALPRHGGYMAGLQFAVEMAKRVRR